MEIQSFGLEDVQPETFWYISVNGSHFFNSSVYGNPPNYRGINTMILDPVECVALDWHQFDTSVRGSPIANDLLDYINYLRDGAIVLGSTSDDSAGGLEAAVKTLNTAGVSVQVAASPYDIIFRGKFAFVFQKGYPEKTVYGKASRGGHNVKIKFHLQGWYGEC